MTTIADDKVGELRGTPDRAILSQDNGQCTKCTAIKPLTEFGGWPRNKWCKPCCSAYQKALRAGGYKPTGRNKKLAELPDRAVRDYLAKAVLTSASNARKRGRVHTLLLEDVLALWYKQGGKCALSGLTLEVAAGGDYVASLDQIDPGMGYTLDNVRLTCWAVNRARGGLSDADYLKVCRAVVRCNDYPEGE